MIKRVSDARKHNEGGFTLIELLVVIVILGILSAVVVFAVRGANNRGEEAATNIDARTLRTAEERFCLSFGRYGSASELVNPPWSASTPGSGQFITNLPTLNQPAVYRAGQTGMPASSPCGSASGTSYQTGFTICGEGSGCGQTAPSPVAQGYEPFGTSVATANTGRDFGGRLEAMGADINNDTVNDVWVRGQTGAGGTTARVYALSGADLAKGIFTPLHTILRNDPVDGSTRFSNNNMTEMTSLEDVNDDGKPDLVVGDPTAGGSARPPSVHSGADGSRLFFLPSPFSSSGYGEVGSAGDVIGNDGKTDIAVGDGLMNTVYIFSGADGTLARTIPNPDGCGPDVRCFGTSVQSPGDVDNDGFEDLLVGGPGWPGGVEPGPGRMWLFSGANGVLLLRIDRPPLLDGSPYAPAENYSFGSAELPPNSPGDLEVNVDGTVGDGHAEIYAAAAKEPGPAGINEGRAWVFDGAASIASGTDAATRVPVVKYMLTDPAPLGNKLFGASMTAGDVNNDGANDLFVGSDPSNAFFGTDRNGGAALFDGATGQVLKVFPTPSQFRQAFKPPECTVESQPVAMGRSVAAPGDLDGDSQLDFIAGARGYNTTACTSSTRDQGLVVTFVSKP